jgi:hypothetical protein
MVLITKRSLARQALNGENFLPKGKIGIYPIFLFPKIHLNSKQVLTAGIYTSPNYITKLNRRVTTTSPNSRHERLFGRWCSFAEKQQRVYPYFQYFSTNSS